MQLSSFILNNNNMKSRNVNFIFQEKKNENSGFPPVDGAFLSKNICDIFPLNVAAIFTQHLICSTLFTMSHFKTCAY